MGGNLTKRNEGVGKAEGGKKNTKKMEKEIAAIKEYNKSFQRVFMKKTNIE